MLSDCIQGICLNVKVFPRRRLLRRRKSDFSRYSDDTATWLPRFAPASTYFFQYVAVCRQVVDVQFKRGVVKEIPTGLSDEGDSKIQGLIA